MKADFADTELTYIASTIALNGAYDGDVDNATSIAFVSVDYEVQSSVNKSVFKSILASQSHCFISSSFSDM